MLPEFFLRYAVFLKYIPAFSAFLHGISVPFFGENFEFFSVLTAETVFYQFRFRQNKNSSFGRSSVSWLPEDLDGIGYDPGF